MVSQFIQKVTREHLHRKAYLYVRQSTLRQTRVHQESTRRQYALKQRAIELGWPKERVVVIDDDQGQSGVTSEDRKGFQKLVADVGIGKAGVVLGLEVSRLARNNSDWHRLLEICGLTRTLILDEDGLYDPCNFNDRLLLGLKGTMSEAESHILKARMRGGLLNKARRGEMYLHLPIGFDHDGDGNIILDPDKQVQQSVRLLFETYRHTGSARGVMVHFHQQGLLFPWRQYGKADKGLEWKKLYARRVVNILHNPAYAGAYAYGRTRRDRRVDGSTSFVRLPQEEWTVLIKNAHEGYISWEEYEKNQKQMLSWDRHNGGANKHREPAREGCALLQGLVICGYCGKHMCVRYHHRKTDDRTVPSYACVREQYKWPDRGCQYITGDGIDDAVSKLIMESVTPLTLEVALNVQKELQQRLEEADKIRRQQIDRARYEANLAQRRYMQVDPDNRLVTESLEVQWNEKLCALERAKDEYERLRREDNMVLNETKQKEILALAKDFPRLWQNPNVTNKQRKRMMRLLIEDVTLLVAKDITINVRFKGGATKTLSIPKPLPYTQIICTPPEVVKKIDTLLDHHIPTEVAHILNEQGFRTGRDGLLFTGYKISQIVTNHHLKSRYDRLRKKGFVKASELAKMLDVCTYTIWAWQKKGLLKTHKYYTNRYLFEPPESIDLQKVKNARTNKLLRKLLSSK